MVRRQTNVWLLLLKWLLIPAVLAVSGYFFLGPIVPKVLPGRAPITVPGTNASEEEKKTFQEPDVEVSVKPAGSSYRSNSSDRPRRRKKKRRTTQPRVETTPVEAPPSDDPPADDPPVTDPTTGGDGGLLIVRFDR